MNSEFSDQYKHFDTEKFLTIKDTNDFVEMLSDHPDFHPDEVSTHKLVGLKLLSFVALNTKNENLKIYAKNFVEIFTKQPG
jgi:hypothetical protein